MKRMIFALVFTGCSLMRFYANAQSAPVTLQSMRDHQRALLVFSNGNNQLAEAQLNVAARHVDGFRQRDLLLVGLTGSNNAVPSTLLSAAEDAAARKRFSVRPDQFTVILIGKDGGEKLRSHQPLSWEKLRSTIDAMPMRQGEMQRGTR
jgi:hypothetical protein